MGSYAETIGGSPLSDYVSGAPVPNSFKVEGKFVDDLDVCVSVRGRCYSRKRTNTLNAPN